MRNLLAIILLLCLASSAFGQVENLHQSNVMIFCVKSGKLLLWVEYGDQNDFIV